MVSGRLVWAFFCGGGRSRFIAMQTAMGFDFNGGGGRYSAEEMIDYIMQEVAVFVGSKVLGVAKDFMNIFERRLTISSDSQSCCRVAMVDGMEDVSCCHPECSIESAFMAF